MKSIALATMITLSLSFADAAEPALGGACPVSLYESGKIVLGKAEHQLIYDQRLYQFPGVKQKALFAANPTKYAPILGGDCIVSWATQRSRAPGKPEHFVLHNEHVYLFPNANLRTTFLRDKAKYELADLPFDCYCPVCLLDLKKVVEGKPEISSRYDGLRYIFPTERAKSRFDANPTKYAPVLSGHCVVCLTDLKKLIPCQLEFGVFYPGRSFLMPSEKARKKFMDNPTVYQNVDLAAAGKCVVCRERGGRRVDGSIDHQVIHHGLRYLFPGKDEKAIFEQSPRTFAQRSPLDPARAVAPPTLTPIPTPPRKKIVETERKVDDVSILGKTACAGCDFGKRPIADPESLGLAIVTADKVYIVDRAEKLYPKIFSDRFEELRVQVKGKVKKQSGKFVWIEPSTVQRVD